MVRGNELDQGSAQGAVEEVIGAYAVEQIRYRAQALARTYGLSETDREDLEWPS